MIDRKKEKIAKNINYNVAITTLWRFFYFQNHKSGNYVIINKIVSHLGLGYTLYKNSLKQSIC